MRPRIFYVLGGPLQPEVEDRKRDGSQPNSEFNRFAEMAGATLISTASFRVGGSTSLKRLLRLAWDVARRAGEYDAVVTSGEDIGFPVALSGMLRRTGKPVYVILHGSFFDSRKYALVAPILRRSRTTHILCLSESLRSRMIERDGFDPARCLNAGYGVDTDFFQPEPFPAERLIVSAGSANRDYRTLIAAAADLDVPVRIAADSLWRPGGVTVADADLPASVKVGSAGDYRGLRDLYAQASVVVVPLHQAGYACGYAVIAEAMAAGRPVIATRTRAPSDLLVDGVTGFYVEPGDVAGLRARIETLLLDARRAEAMGRAAADRMREHFGLRQYCDKILDAMQLGAAAD